MIFCNWIDRRHRRRCVGDGRGDRGGASEGRSAKAAGVCCGWGMSGTAQRRRALMEVGEVDVQFCLGFSGCRQPNTWPRSF